MKFEVSEIDCDKILNFISITGTNNEILEKLAAKYKVSVAKLCINYCLKKNTLPLPKSVHQDRIYDNFDVEFKITKKDMEYLDSLKNIGSYKKLRS